MEYRIGKKEDIGDIIDFANYVFSQNECPHEFKSMLPKLYAGRENSAQHHYLAISDGRIKAMVCALPLEYITPAGILKTACIGMVSVHPYARGKGYMKELMQQAIRDLKEKGCAYLFLGGQRQRYEYFGFEPAGIKLEFLLTRTNLRHAYPDSGSGELEIVPCMGEELLEEAYALYERQPYRMYRSREEFYDILCSWKSSPYAVLHQGKLAGYFVLGSEGTVAELLLQDSSLYPELMRGLFDLSKRDSHKFLVSPAEPEKVDLLLRVAETWSITTDESYLIFDWAAIISALLHKKAEYESLPEGEAALRIGNTTVHIAVRNNKPVVYEDSEPAEIILDPLEATALCFSPAGEYLLNKYIAKLDKEKYACVRRWFPLPLFSAPSDCC